MVSFYENRSYWHGGFTEDQQKCYKEYRLFVKGIFILKLIAQLERYAKKLRSDYDKSSCCDESCWCLMFKHLPFQCWCNDNETLVSYTKGHYDFFDVEQIEEFVVLKGAYEIASFVENIDDSPYKSESLNILKYYFGNFNYNSYITDYLKRFSPQEEETNAFQDSMEEEITETECSLDEKVGTKGGRIE